MSASSPAPDLNALEQEIQSALPHFKRLKETLQQVIMGQNHLLDRLLIALLGNGHILLEGVPGLAKTLSIRVLSQAVKADFKRVQFTPDLLPADVIGTRIYNAESRSFEIKQGPVFTNFLLGDEINRAPPKVQSALLEAMQERQVTIGQKTYELAQPFLVLATQNPLEQEGTYPLPEAQLDRFMLKVHVDYPNEKEELQILAQHLEPELKQDVSPVMDAVTIRAAQSLVRRIYVDPKVRQYIVDLVFATRHSERFNLELNELIRAGASPRASINLAHCARVHAFLQGRGFVTPEDVKAIAMDVMRHRILLTYEAEAREYTADHLVQMVLEQVTVP